MRIANLGAVGSLAVVAAVLMATVNTAAQDPEAIEAELALDRPTRRLIQQGLAAESFDPGAPDGLFGPRTRAAIWAWQAAQGTVGTGYLDAAQAEALRIAAAPPAPVASGETMDTPPPATTDAGTAASEPPGSTAPLPPPLPAPALPEAGPAPALAAVSCDYWNTEEFFETATIEEATACLGAGLDVEARAVGLNENPAVVEALLAAGADVEARDNGLTPLHFAARSNENPAVVEALLAAGADPTAQALRLAIHYNENPAVVEVLLAAGADPTAAVGYSDTPLHLAARYNANPAVVEALLAAGAGVDARDNGGSLPLHLAARYNANPAVVEALLAAGADPAAQDDNGRTPLYMAARYNANPVDALLAALDAERCEIWNTRGFFRTATVADVTACMATGADVAVRDNNGNTPLHLAARYNANPAVVEALLAAGADPPTVQAVNTLLHLAAGSNANPAVVEALLAAGADVEARDNDGNTPLHMASRNTVSVIRALLAAGARLDARNMSGGMPLHSAADRAIFGRSAIEILLQAGARLDARDGDGNTPLHLAANTTLSANADRMYVRRAGEAIEALLDAGANPTARNAAGETPWDLANGNETLRGSDAYWRLNEARFDEPVQESSPPGGLR